MRWSATLARIYKAIVRFTITFGKVYKMLAISNRFNGRVHHRLKNEMEFFVIAILGLELEQELVLLVGDHHELAGDY